MILELLITALALLYFAAILWLANLADRYRVQGGVGTAVAAVSYALLFIAYSLMGLLGAIVWSTTSTLAALGICVPVLLGLLLLAPPIRRLVARFLPVDPASTAHAVALAYLMLAPMQLGFLYGSGVTDPNSAASVLGAFSESGLIATTWLQSLGFVLIAMVGVGWLSRRSLSAAFERLGMVKPTPRQVGIALASGFGLVLISLFITFVAEWLGLAFVDEGLRRLNEQTTGLLQQSLPGVLTIGLAAAIGEEMIFRGALQPRFNILLTSLIFALFHANYGVSGATAVILMLGLSLGVLRRRYNTSTAIITHAAYNILISLPVLVFGP